MPKTKPNSIPRRDFLRGAAGLVGATVLGVGRDLAQAQGIGSGGSGSGALSVVYWDGIAWVPAAMLTSGDPSLASVRLGLQGFGQTASIRSIDALPEPTFRFGAWYAPPAGASRTMFTMPVDVKGTVRLVAHVAAPTPFDASILLVSGRNSGSKLREGVYAIAYGSVDWVRYGYQPSHVESPIVDASGVAASFPYVLMTVERV